MRSPIVLISERQFSLAYLLAEMALIAITLAAARLAVLSVGNWIEVRAVLFCIALTAGCGAAGGVCFRMALGLIGGGVFSVSSIPLICLAIASR